MAASPLPELAICSTTSFPCPAGMENCLPLGELTPSFLGQLELILDLKRAHTVPQPSAPGPQSHFPEVLKKSHRLRAVLEPSMAFCSLSTRALSPHGVMGSVLHVGTQGSMPGPWRLGAPSAIVLGVTGGIFLAEGEAEKQCEMAPSSPLTPHTQASVARTPMRAHPGSQPEESPRGLHAEPP